MILKKLTGRKLIMMNEEQKSVVVQNETSKNIMKRVLKLEKLNYASKPDGLKDYEMVEQIKRIIEQEVGK